MSDPIGEVTPENVQFDQTQEVNTEVETQAPAETGGNPAWEGIRSKLDPISFKQIEDDLKGFDRSANERIAAQNKAYAPWKQFADTGATPEKVAAALQVAERLDADPEGVYQFLEGFLTQNGRMPSKQEVAQAQANGELEEQPVQDPRIDQLAASQQQIQDFLKQQVEQQQVYEAESALDQELDQLKQAHPDLGPEDIQEVIRRAAIAAQTTGNIPSLEEAFADFDLLRNRIRSIPRPGDSAPRLPSPSGGMAPGAPQKKLGELSRQDVQANFTQFLEANR